MSFTLVDSLIGIVNAACKNRRHFLLKSQFSNILLKKSRFCSSANESDSPHSSNESKIKTLLNSASPLRSAELNVDEDMWATSPYPAGTVFTDIKSEEPDEKFSDDSTKSVILFPGQGNQFVGMGKNLVIYPAALEMFQAASHILKYNLKKICFEGPEHLLNNTKYCQPATFVCSLALLEKLKVERPWALSNCMGTCGYSLGELTALVFAGCVSFETGLKLVDLRAKAMAECCEKTPGGMLTVFIGPHTTLGAAFSDAIEHCRMKGIENPVCAIASYLYPNCKVIAGNMEALDFLVKNAKKYGIKRHSKLPVSGAFHTTLMKDASEYFKEKIQEIQFQRPLIKVFSNVTGKPYKNEDHIKKLLPKQIFSPVKWEQTVHNIFLNQKGLPSPFFYECGPGSSLVATIKKVNLQVAPTCFAVQL